MPPEGSRQHPIYPNYWVSPNGRVFRRVNITHPERHQWTERKHEVVKDGYLRVKVCDHRVLVHRLVYLIWHGPLVEGLVVCHLDGDRTNNHFSNLAQVTQKENIGHKVDHGTHQIGEAHPASKITLSTALQIKRLLVRAKKSPSGRIRHGEVQRIGAETGATDQTIYSISYGKAWKHVSAGS